MSFTDRLVLWLHIGFVIFTIGPVTAAIMSTPRYIRARNLVIVRYLYRTTRIFALISLGVLVFGIILAQQLDELAKPWLSVALTLFVVAIVLLLIVIRDQRKAISALEVAEAAEGSAVPAAAGPVASATVPDSSPEAQDDALAAGQPEPVQPGAPGTAGPGTAGPGTARQVATVERGRITTLGAVVTVIWLVILVLMVWR